MKNNKSIPLDGVANFVSKFTDDFNRFANKKDEIPDKCTYTIEHSVEPHGVLRSARKAAFASIIDGDGFIKTASGATALSRVAFDTRRIDQESERNPRTNLQYWNRSQQFIDEELQGRLERIARLIKPLEKIQNKYGQHPEYFQSFARSLHDSVNRIIKVNESDMNVFRPQLDYLEQLLFARYRLSMDDLLILSEDSLTDRIISKDENLLKRGSFLHLTGGPPPPAQASIVKNDTNLGITQESIVNAIFGNNDFRRDGEKTVERTITITIRDQVMDG